MFDKDGSGSIDVHEYLVMVTLLDISEDEDKMLENIFHVFDKDGSGTIGFEEYRRLITDMSMFLKGPNELAGHVQAGNDFCKIDKDGNMQVTLAEFKAELRENEVLKDLITENFKDAMKNLTDAI